MNKEKITKVDSLVPEDSKANNQDRSSEDSGNDLDIIERLTKESEANYDKYLRAVADLENVKKRAIKERSDLIKYAGESLARDLLEVLDHLELALAQKTPGVNEELFKGVSMVRDQFVGIFERHSIKIKSGIGKPFDPEYQEVVANIPSDKHEPGTVIDEFRKAYLFKDRLLRPAQVAVACANKDAK